MAIGGVSLNPLDIIEALILKKGSIRKAALHVKCSEACIYEWRKKDPNVEKAVHDGRELFMQELAQQDQEIVEEAYKSITDLVKAKDATSVLFTLKCKANWNDKAALTNHHNRIEIIDARSDNKDSI